ncbi:MAG: capsule assembly Wzi family protein, partial [Terracidiphilus sp.]
NQQVIGSSPIVGSIPGPIEQIDSNMQPPSIETPFRSMRLFRRYSFQRLTPQLPVPSSCSVRILPEVRVKLSLRFVTLMLFFATACAAADAQSQSPIDSDPYAGLQETDTQGSTYVPIDSWIYPALDRLHALGYLDSAFLGLRPWTRMSIAHMLEFDEDRVESEAGDDEARAIYEAVLREIKPDMNRTTEIAHPHAELESVYTALRGISGTPLRDSFHLGQTLVNDYGRPYEGGFNNYTGFSGRAEAGRFSLYFRGEFQHAPSAVGYSPTLAAFLSNTTDDIPFASDPVQDTIPEGPIAAANHARIVEANLSYHLLGHEVSIGKNDHWLGPDKGASMLWSNNAENSYDFEINRVEPLHVPGLSTILGPFRYDFFVGSLKGHTYPNDPWVHVEKVSFKPTRDLEFGFDRMVIWGGKGHEPITLHTFLKSFFSFQNVTAAEKFSADDPGARFGTFDFSYRLPFLNRWITLYTDSLVHDDVSPISAPRRSGLHPGIYLARFPHFEHLDLRLEGANTEPTSHYAPDGTPFNNGQFLYYEAVQRQGPTNKGFLVGDWVGREGEGGQAWLTYHLSPQEEVHFMYRRAKAAKVFIPGGTTQNDFEIYVCKRVMKDFEMRGSVQYEEWKAPIYQTGGQSDTSTTFQITWFPRNAN